MKLTHNLSLIALLVGYTATPALARDMVVALSPHVAASEQMDRIKIIAGHLLDTIQHGETAHVIDGHSLQLIGSFVVPDGEAYHNPRARISANRSFFADLKAFAESSEVTSDQPEQLDLPGLLRHVGDYFPASGTTDMIVFGSPIHDDARQPSLSMVRAAVPNDGHVGAAPAVSPYGVEGRDQKMEGYRILMILPDMDWSIRAEHAAAVQRYVSLSVTQQGGELIAFTPDVASALRVAGSDDAGLDQAPFAPTEKLEMISFAPDAAELPVIYARELTAEVPTARTLAFAERVEVGLSWDCDCDIDIFARPHAGAEVIYFGDPSTAEGRLFKDFLTSPSATNGFETIAFSEPVDLNKLRLAANFYAGSAIDGVTGEVRIAIGERTWAQSFKIEASTGNGSEGAAEALASGSAPNDGWVIIDPAAVVLRR